MMRVTVLVTALMLAGPLPAQDLPPDVLADIVAQIGAPPDWSARAPMVTGALRVAEDRRFSEATDGRSTITRDLLRMLDLPPERTERLALIGLTAAVGRELPARTILNAYADRIFLGRRCQGIAAAAKAYFGQPPEALNAPRAAMLAALVRAPTDLDRRPERIRERMGFVLEEMSKVGMIPAGAEGKPSAMHLPAFSGGVNCPRRS